MGGGNVSTYHMHERSGGVVDLTRTLAAANAEPDWPKPTVSESRQKAAYAANCAHAMASSVREGLTRSDFS